MDESLNRAFTALADPTRRAILARLALGEATVSELARPFAISQPAISRHLKVLERAGLIEGGRSAQARPRRLKAGALDAPAAWLDRLCSLWSDSFDRLDAFLKTSEEEQEPAMSSPRFTIRRRFAAPRARVWDAWTRPEQIARWFGPKGSSGHILAFDLRPGGEWRGRMEAPGQGAMHSKFVFREIEPPSKLVWVHGFADAEGNRIRAPFSPLFPLEMLTTVLFADDAGGTRIDLSWEPIDATPEELAFFAGMMGSMQGGWSGSFEQLDALLAAK